MHSATGLTPKEARNPSNELEAYVNMKLKAKRNSKYIEIRVGDKVYIYMQRKTTQKSHISLFSDIAYNVQDISRGNPKQILQLPRIDPIQCSRELIYEIVDKTYNTINMRIATNMARASHRMLNDGSPRVAPNRVKASYVTLSANHRDGTRPQEGRLRCPTGKHQLPPVG